MLKKFLFAILIGFHVMPAHAKPFLDVLDERVRGLRQAISDIAPGEIVCSSIRQDLAYRARSGLNMITHGQAYDNNYNTPKTYQARTGNSTPTEDEAHKIIEFYHTLADFVHAIHELPYADAFLWQEKPGLLSANGKRVLYENSLVEEDVARDIRVSAFARVNTDRKLRFLQRAVEYLHKSKAANEAEVFNEEQWYCSRFFFATALVQKFNLSAAQKAALLKAFAKPEKKSFEDKISIIFENNKNELLISPSASNSSSTSSMTMISANTNPSRSLTKRGNKDSIFMPDRNGNVVVTYGANALIVPGKRAFFNARPNVQITQSVVNYSDVSCLDIIIGMHNRLSGQKRTLNNFGLALDELDQKTKDRMKALTLMKKNNFTEEERNWLLNGPLSDIERMSLTGFMMKVSSSSYSSSKSYENGSLVSSYQSSHSTSYYINPFIVGSNTNLNAMFNDFLRLAN